jgi:peptide deformylase
MSILNICRLGNPVLRQKAKPVPLARIASAEIQTLIFDMLETMAEYEGIGLAAPQVRRSLQICVFGLALPSAKARPQTQTRVLINPVIKPIGRARAAGWEGCLSLPGLRARVDRFRRIRVTGYTPAGKKISFTASGLPAIVIQHEADHLHGLVFLDRVTDRKSLTFNEEYQKYFRQSKG